MGAIIPGYLCDADKNPILSSQIGDYGLLIAPPVCDPKRIGGQPGQYESYAQTLLRIVKSRMSFALYRTSIIRGTGPCLYSNGTATGTCYCMSHVWSVCLGGGGAWECQIACVRACVYHTALAWTYALFQFAKAANNSRNRDTCPNRRNGVRDGGHPGHFGRLEEEQHQGHRDGGLRLRKLFRPCCCLLSSLIRHGGEVRFPLPQDALPLLLTNAPAFLHAGVSLYRTQTHRSARTVGS